MFPVKIDKGWAWLVCIGTFLATFLEIGMVKALGVLLPILRAQYVTHTWTIGVIIAFVPGFGAVTCPLAGALSKRYSARYIVMIFNFLSALGLISGSLAPSIPMLSVSFLLTGFSIGAEAIAIGELSTYFYQYYSIANAIALTGASVGILVMPLLCQFLIDIYGLRGAMLLLGGIKLHSIISGALLIPINQSLKKWPHDDKVDETIQQKNLKKDRLLKSYEIKQDGTDESYTSSNGSTNNQLQSLVSSLFYYLDIALFNDANFVSIVLYCIGNGYCFAGWLIYLVPYGLDAGFAPYKASSLATFGGVGNLLGNVLFPLLIRGLHSSHILYIGTFVSFLALVLNPICATLNSYIGLVVLSALFGWGRGFATLAFYQNCKETLEDATMTNAVMWIHLSYSIGAIASGFVSGWIYDHSGSYATSFYILGTISLLSVGPKVCTDFSVSRKSINKL